jgi:3alpha(or 20beta)-hydroxysteroid dehydrogenase
MGRMQGKVAIISGGSRGMGALHAETFVAEGAKVMIGDVLDDQGTVLADKLGENAAYQHLDVTKGEDWEAIVARTVELFGQLDVLVNNAGIMRLGGVENLSDESYLEMFKVNEFGVFLGMKHAVPAMRAAGGGSIVNISSESGLTGKGNLIGYSASKWAVRGMSKCAARDLGKHNIRVNSVHPGGVETDFVHTPELERVDRTNLYDGLPIPRRAEPEEITPLVVYLASDESSFATGAEFVIDGGMTSGTDLGGKK